MRNNKQLRNSSQFAKCEETRRKLNMSKSSNQTKQSRFKNSDGSIKAKEFIQVDKIDNYTFQTRLISAYGDWIKLHWENGWDVYLFTFVFKQMPGSPDKKIEQMFKEIGWVYGRLLTRTFKKKARSPRWTFVLPRGIFFADRPGPRRRGHKHKLHQVAPNDGLHVHGLVAVVRPGSARWLLDKHFRNNEKAYLIGHIKEINVRPITHEPQYTTEYGSKGLKSRTFSSDHVLVLPKSLDELADKTPRQPDPIKDIQSATNVSDESAKAISGDPKLVQLLLGKR